MWLRVLVVLTGLLTIGQPCAHAETLVTVHADQDGGPVNTRTGWILGSLTPLSYSKMAPLNTRSWKIDHFAWYDNAAPFCDDITFSLSGHWFKTGHGRPADDWAVYENWVATHVWQSINENMPIAYWDIWNEADHEAFWAWSWEELLETFKRAHDVIKAIDPNAQLTGPSFAGYVAKHNFNHKTTARFVADLDATHGIRLEAVSWHMNVDNGNPNWIINYSNHLRQTLDSMDPPYNPVLYITEYTNAQNHLKPAVLGSYVYYMDRARIDLSNMACWQIYRTCQGTDNTYTSCLQSLNGTFMYDGYTEQPNYWFWLWHGQETGVRLVADDLQYGTFVLASRNDSNEEIRICVGRHDDPLYKDLYVTVDGYPFSGGQVLVETWHLRDQHKKCQLNEWNPKESADSTPPPMISSRMVDIVGGEIRLQFPAVWRNDVYFIRITNVIDEISPRKPRRNWP